jgi:hypothetical protein
MDATGFTINTVGIGNIINNLLSTGNHEVNLVNGDFLVYTATGLFGVRPAGSINSRILFDANNDFVKIKDCSGGIFL